MKISTKGRYGLRAMVDMAINTTEEYTPLNLIAERQKISENYLEQVFSMLKKSDLVKSVRGYQGGYTLSREPSKITVGEILRVLEGELNIVDENFSIEEKSNKIEDSINRIVWNQINESINNVVDSITLDFLVLEYKRTHYSNSFDYSI